MRKVREIKDLKIDEISLVDKGANQHASVTIAKRDTDYYDIDGFRAGVHELEPGSMVFGEDGGAYVVEESGVTKSVDTDDIMSVYQDSGHGEKESYMDELYDYEGHEIDQDLLEEGDHVFDVEGNEYVVAGDDEVEKAAALSEKDYRRGAATMGGALGAPGASFHAASRAPKGKKVKNFLGSGLGAWGGKVAGSNIGAIAGRPFGPTGMLIGGATGGVLGAGTGANLVSREQLRRGSVLIQNGKPRRSNDPKVEKSYDEPYDEYYDDEDIEKSMASVGSFARGVRGSLRPGAARNAAELAGRNFGQGARNLYKNPKARWAAGGALAGGGTMAAVQKSYTEEMREELSKAMSDEDRDEVFAKAFGRMEELEEIAKAAQEQAEIERYVRLENEYVELAKNFEVGVSPDELGPVLMRMSEVLDDEDLEVIGKALGGASEITKAYYDEIGAAGNGANLGIAGDVDEIVDQYVSKSGGVSREELTSNVYAEHPEAYEQYLYERNGRW